MREDIIGAMKNAIERGATPQQAARSLINSGYNREEVKSAMNYVTGGVLSTLSHGKPNPHEKIPTLSSRPPQQQTQVQTQQQNVQPKKVLPTVKPSPNPNYRPNKESSGGGAKTLILFIILFVLVGALAVSIFFKDEILSLFGG